MGRSLGQPHPKPATAALPTSKRHTGIGKNARGRRKSEPVTKIIIYSDSSLDGFYKQTIEYLHGKYHSHPTTLNGQPGNPEQFAHDAMARDAGRNAISGDPGNVPIGKRVF